MQARDIMTTNVVSVEPETEVQEIAKLLAEHRISAVPVLDGDDRLVGIVNEGDLMRRPEAGTLRPASWWLWLLLLPEEQARKYVKTHGRHVHEVMTQGVITIDEDDPLEAIADLLEKAPHQARPRCPKQQTRWRRQPCRPSPWPRCPSRRPLSADIAEPTLMTKCRIVRYYARHYERQRIFFDAESAGTTELSASAQIHEPVHHATANVSPNPGSLDDGPEVETLKRLGNRKDQYFDQTLAQQGVQVYENIVVADLRELSREKQWERP